MATTEIATKWALKGTGYEFCNCDFGCGCNFGGFPNSKDGSCRAFVGVAIKKRFVQETLISPALTVPQFWRGQRQFTRTIGKCVFVVDPSTTDAQIERSPKSSPANLAGCPGNFSAQHSKWWAWKKTKITIEGSGVKSVSKRRASVEGHGDSFKNPVTGEDHQAIVDLPDGFIWKKGECGQGSYHASAAGVSIGAEKTNWILYAFDWSNA